MYSFVVSSRTPSPSGKAILPLAEIPACRTLRSSLSKNERGAAELQFRTGSRAERITRGITLNYRVSRSAPRKNSGTFTYGENSVRLISGERTEAISVSVAWPITSGRNESFTVQLIDLWFTTASYVTIYAGLRSDRCTRAADGGGRVTIINGQRFISTG